MLCADMVEKCGSALIFQAAFAAGVQSLFLVTDSSPTSSTEGISTITKSSGDPVCDMGIVYGNVCCHKFCEVCSKPVAAS